MLRLVTNLDKIGEYVRLMRINFMREKGKIVTTNRMEEYEDFTIKIKPSNRQYKFKFHGFIPNRAGKIGGFGCEIPVKLFHKTSPIKSLGLDISAPQIVENDETLSNGDIFFEDHAFFAIDEDTNQVKLFHTCNFKRPWMDIEKSNKIDWEKVNRRFIEAYQPKLATAVSQGGITRSGMEIYNLSTGKFKYCLNSLIWHIKRENSRLIRESKNPTPEQIFEAINEQSE